MIRSSMRLARLGPAPAISLVAVALAAAAAASPRALAADPTEVASAATRATPASPDDARTDELQARVRALEAEVARLRAATPPTGPGTGGAGERSPADAKSQADAAVRAASADAAARGWPSPAAAFNAGFTDERGFVVQSDDRQFVLHPSVLFQFRNVAVYRESGKHGGTAADAQDGFEVRRLWLTLDGNFFSDDFTYQFVWGTDRKTGTPGLQDAWVQYRLPGTPLAIRGGQIRDALDHEQLTFAGFTLAADRSLVNDLFANAEGNVQGVSLVYGGEAVRAEVAVTDGLRSANTNFQDFPTTSANWGVAGRAEWRLAGAWRQYADFTARDSRRELLVLGVGADYTEAGDTAALTHVADAQYETPGGLSVYAAYLGRYTRNNGGLPGTNGGATGAGATDDTYDATVRLQVGQTFGERWEPFVRYEYLQLDGRRLAAARGPSTVHEFAAGVNYYLQGHHAKATADVLYLPNGSPVADDATGVLVTGADGGEVVFRAQFQLWR